jgi:hypothetical protein
MGSLLGVIVGSNDLAVFLVMKELDTGRVIELQVWLPIQEVMQ